MVEYWLDDNYQNWIAAILVSLANDKNPNALSDLQKEIEEFVGELTTSQFEKLVEFFNTMPKLRHVITVTNPKTKKKNEVVLEGLQSFLE